MRFGLSIGAGGESPKVFNFFTGQYEGGATKAGLHFGPSGEVIFDRNLAVATAFNINTQSGTPIEWMKLFKYYFSIPGSKIKPYADAGFSLYFVTGGPYVSIPFGRMRSLVPTLGLCCRPNRRFKVLPAMAFKMANMI